MHESELMKIEPPVVPGPTSEDFVLHLHKDGIPIWKTDGHTIGKKTEHVEMVGTISIGDIVYMPVDAP